MNADEQRALVVPGIGAAADLTNRFEEARIDGNALRLAAGPRTDTFADPNGRPAEASAPILWFDAPRGDFVFGATVAASHADTFDAGAVLMRAGDRWWVKLAHELSPQKVPMIVTVVSTPVSDDANGPVVTAGSVCLRVLRTGTTIACHWREDDGPWQLVRYAACPPALPMQVGLSVQSPVGEGCTSAFSSVFLESGAPKDIRSGD